MQLSEEQLDDLWDECACEDGSIPFVSRRRFVEKVLEFRAQADARPVAWCRRDTVKNWAGQLVNAAYMFPSPEGLKDPIALYTHPEASAPGLSETVENTIKTIERQLELIAERAPGDYLDKRPVVQSLNAHIQRLRKALSRASAATVAEPSIPSGWRGRLQEMRDASHTYSQYPELAQAVFDSVIDALGEMEAAQSGQRAGVASKDTKRLDAMELGVDVQRVRNPNGWRSRYMYGAWLKQDFESLREAIDAAAPTQQQEGGK